VPLYEYECQACHGRLEAIQKFSDPPKTRCPKCMGRLKRLLSAPGIHFKGSGWYITDYARKGGSGAGADAGSAPESRSGESPAGEGKAAESKAEAGKPAAGGASSARPARRPARRSPARRSRR
jgi:putative FmdB family regulatory protein